MLMLPEFIVLGTAFLILFLDLFLTDSRRVVLAPLAMLGLAGAACSVMFLLGTQGEMLGGRFGFDNVAGWFKIIFILATLLTIAISLDTFDGRIQKQAMKLPSCGEFYMLMLFALSGMMFLISSRDIVSLYVSLELATLPLFLMAAWRRDSLSGEAGLKYVVLGALSSAIMLYGLGILFGLSGETQLDLIRQKLIVGPAFWFAAGLVTAGIGFKLTVVPFHMWAAEVYEGAPAPVTAYLSVASKAAGLALMFQLFYRVFGTTVQSWGAVMAVLAAVTMTLGNLVAIVQSNIKRFMAFSAISQAGYLLMGFIGTPSMGIPAMLFYMLVYVLTNLCVFGVIMLVSNQTGKEQIEDYRGLARINPLMALAMMVGLFSLAGIPPLSGFVGKFFLFSIASQAGFHWLVALAAINSTISLYYYLRIVRQMYIVPLDSQTGSAALPVTTSLGLAVTVTALATVVLGVIPGIYETVYATTTTWFH